MAVLKKENKLRKMNKRLEYLQKINPEMARRLEGKIAAYKARKD